MRFAMISRITAARSFHMTSAIRFIARASSLVSLIALLAGCVIAPPGGYSDRPRDGYHQDRSRRDCHDRRYGDGRDEGDDRCQG